MPDPDQVLSVAIFDIIEGKEEECLRVLRELYDLLEKKDYSRNLLLRDNRQPQRVLNARFWKSEQARLAAAEDPDVHRYWQRLPELLRMVYVFEHMEAIPGFASQKEELFP